MREWHFPSHIACCDGNVQYRRQALLKVSLGKPIGAEETTQLKVHRIRDGSF